MDFLKIIYLLFVLGICVYTDYKDKKIKNSCILAIIAGVVLFLALDFQGHAMLKACFYSLLSGGILFLLYCIGALGAGDVKLISMTVLYIGSSGIREFLMGTVIAGGVISLAKLVYYGTLVKRMRYFKAYIVNAIASGKPGVYEMPESESEIVRLAIPVFVGGVCWSISLV